MKAIIPKWIIIYLWFLTIMTIVFTLIGYLMPDIYSVTWQNSEDTSGTLNLYISRNIAIIVVYLFALYNQKLRVFKAVFVLRGVIDLLDFFQDAINGNLLAMLIPLILFLIDIYTLVKLYSLKKSIKKGVNMNRILLLIALSSSVIIAQEFNFVGNSKCKMCHKKEEKGAQYVKWEASHHANAFETLKTEKAEQIAKEKGIEVDAWKSPICVKCHTTGFEKGGYEIKGDDFWNPVEDDKDGKKAVKRMIGLQAVGCEACHGAGSKYKSKKTMQGIYAGELDGAEYGLQSIGEEACKVCHNESSPTFKPFNFEERVEKIAHPIPVN